jgi:hypothetical protein
MIARLRTHNFGRIQHHGWGESIRVCEENISPNDVQIGPGLERRAGPSRLESGMADCLDV